EHEDDELRGGNGEVHLQLGGRGERGGGLAALQTETTGVEQGVLPLLDLGRDDVAGDAGLIVDDGDAFPRQAIEEAALADIGSADDGYGTGHGGEGNGGR